MAQHARHAGVRPAVTILNWRLPASLWPFTATMAAIAGVLLFTAVPAAALSSSPLRIPWWALALGFAVTEATHIRIPVHRDAHSISLSEIPLLMGFVFAAPAALLAGRLVGSFVTLATYRKQRPVKLAFNLGLFAMETMVGVVLFRFLIGSAPASEPRGWVAAIVATTVGIVLSASTINAAVTVLRGRRPRGETLPSFVAGVLISVGMTFVGTLCYLIVWHDPQALAVLGGAMAMFYLLLRVYGSLTERHDDLRAVYSFANVTSMHLGVGDVQKASLAEVVRLLRAESVKLVLVTAGEPPLLVTMHDDGSLTRQVVAEEDAAWVLAIAGRDPRGRRASPGCTDPGLNQIVGGANRHCAIVSPLAMSGDLEGAMAAIGRVGPEREYSAEDLELLDALASHAALTLERALTVERLTEEIVAKQEIIRSKDQLIAAVSHELRTPLTGILGFSELLVESGADFDADDRDGMLRAVAADALDMSNLVEDLLTAARARMGVLAIEAQPVALRELARTVVEHRGTPAGRVVVFGDSGAAYADPARVRQILRNLMVNAERYGGDRVEIRVEADAPFVTLRVCDDGPGVEPSMQQRIFDAYESAHRPETQPGSLGLGLAISRTLARMMGGDLTYSHVDGWSSFELRLPAAAAQARPAGVDSLLRTA